MTGDSLAAILIYPHKDQNKLTQDCLCSFTYFSKFYKSVKLCLNCIKKIYKKIDVDRARHRAIILSSLCHSYFIKEKINTPKISLPTVSEYLVASPGIKIFNTHNYSSVL